MWGVSGGLGSRLLCAEPWGRHVAVRPAFVALASSARHLPTQASGVKRGRCGPPRPCRWPTSKHQSGQPGAYAPSACTSSDCSCPIDATAVQAVRQAVAEGRLQQYRDWLKTLRAAPLAPVPRHEGAKRRTSGEALDALAGEEAAAASAQGGADGSSGRGSVAGRPPKWTKV